MSTPNTSLVKWAHVNFLWGLPVRNPEYVPVIPLADLTELVEGLKYIDAMLCERTLCGHFTPEEIRQETQRLLTQLEAQELERVEDENMVIKKAYSTLEEQLAASQARVKELEEAVILQQAKQADSNYEVYEMAKHQRDAAVQEAGRLREALAEILTFAPTQLGLNGVRRVAQRALKETT